MSMLDLDALRATPLQTDPFDFLCVPGFVRAPALESINRDYPDVPAGSIPLGLFRHGPSFQTLIDELQTPLLRQAFEEKFQIDLKRYPQMFTVRGRCRATDGKIHPDSESKVLTVLVYMNPPWEASGGRLRILRSRNLNDYVAEVPPNRGTLIAFRRTDTSWHGHESFEGPRRAVQMNWVKGRRYIWLEQWRHRLGAWSKMVTGRDMGHADY
ncbi:MAG: 2OG-Fe(II) oxygenase [Rhodospirillaceae bacterium]